MFGSFWMRALWITFCSLIVWPCCGEIQTVLPDGAVRCYGLVPTSQARNSMYLTGANNNVHEIRRQGRTGRFVKCDRLGYIILLRTDCVAIQRGYAPNRTGPRFGCVDKPCAEDLPGKFCKVDKEQVAQALDRLREKSQIKPKEKRGIIEHEGTPFNPRKINRNLVLADY